MMVDHEEKASTEKESSVKADNSDSNIHWNKPLKKSLTNSEILAQAFLFMIAGSETTATAMSYLAYLLAKHPEIQNRLYDEVVKAYSEHVFQNNYLTGFNKANFLFS